MTKLLIAVDAVGLRAAAGPVTAGAVAFPEHATEPVFAIPGRQGLQQVRLRDARAKIPFELYPQVAQHLRRVATAVAHVHQSPQESPARQVQWVAMGTAAVRVAERAARTGPADVYSAVELWIPRGGYCPPAIVGKTGQRPADDDWRRAAAHVIARLAHWEQILHMHDAHPAYDFINNFGALTQRHKYALEKYGPTQYHRGNYAAN